jgi:hypothetical protein
MNVTATIDINGTPTVVTVVDVTTNGSEIAVTYVTGSVLYTIIKKRPSFGPTSSGPVNLGTSATVN